MKSKFFCVLPAASVFFPAFFLAAAPSGNPSFEKFLLNGEAAAAASGYRDLLAEHPGERKVFLHFLEAVKGADFKNLQTLFDLSASKLKNPEEKFLGNIGLCKYYRLKKDYPRAKDKCHRALFDNPLSPDVYRETALVHSETGSHGRAVENFKHFISLSTSSYKGYLALADEYFKTGKRILASKNYEKALSLLPPGTRKTKKVLEMKKRIAAANGKKAPPKIDISKCLKDAESLRDGGKPLSARSRVRRCLESEPENKDARLLYGSVLISLGKYEKAIEEYQKTAGMRFSDDVKAYCHMKIAETLEKMGKIDDAAASYEKSLELNPDDMNALEHAAECYEKKGDYRKSLEKYVEILKREPGNKRAEKKAAELEILSATDEDILRELKKRGMAAGNVSSPSAKDRKTFKYVVTAESNRAVETLKSRGYPLPPLTLKDEREWGGEKIILNARGFAVYRKIASQKAIRFFEGEKIRVGTIFKLRTVAGEPFFDEKGLLTPRGFTNYLKAAEGEKTWLMPYENIPESPGRDKYARQVSRLRQDGYREISEPEFLWLLRATDCPEDVLTPPKETYLRILDTPGGRRYFLCYIAQSDCSPGDSKLLLSVYIERYRKGDDTIPDLGKSTGFFGTGAVEKSRFCKDGKIWMGE